MSKRLLLLPLLVSVTCPAAWAQAPAGAEFQVNSHSTSGQRYPAAASDADGSFVVVWDSYGQDGYSYGVFGRRFNAAGFPQGSEFQVNSYTLGWQRHPKVASDANGNFVVVWQTCGPWGGSCQDGNAYGVFGQRFNAGGLAQGSEFQVNSYTTGNQIWPAVASDASGSFVVVWVSVGQDGSGGGIFGRRFNAAGLPQGSEFRVSSYTTGNQDFPAVASDANGSFAVVWENYWDVFGQRFNPSGLPEGGEFQVNSYTTGFQGRPAVATDSSGTFVVVWVSVGQDGSGGGIFGQRFSAGGLPQGPEFQVNSYTTSHQSVPSVASAANGNFVVVWESYGDQDGNSGGVFGQRFNASGVTQSSEFQVNSYSTGPQIWPAAASDATGNFVVAWHSIGQDGSSYGIFGQRFGDLIFRDGFQ